MAAVTISSDLGAQENKVSYCFHYFSIYLSWSDHTKLLILRTMKEFLPTFTVILPTLLHCSSTITRNFLHSNEPPATIMKKLHVIRLDISELSKPNLPVFDQAFSAIPSAYMILTALSPSRLFRISCLLLKLAQGLCSWNFYSSPLNHQLLLLY